jgi:hypothetical protein
MQKKIRRMDVRMRKERQVQPSSWNGCNSAEGDATKMHAEREM